MSKDQKENCGPDLAIRGIEGQPIVEVHLSRKEWPAYRERFLTSMGYQQGWSLKVIWEDETEAEKQLREMLSPQRVEVLNFKKDPSDGIWWSTQPDGSKKAFMQGKPDVDRNKMD